MPTIPPPSADDAPPALPEEPEPDVLPPLPPEKPARATKRKKPRPASAPRPAPKAQGSARPRSKKAPAPPRPKRSKKAAPPPSVKLSGALARPAPAAPEPDANVTRLDFEFTLTGHRGEAPRVRIWVDANRDGQMDAEEQVRPLQRERTTWRGSYMLPGGTSREIGFRVIVSANPGTRWRLRVFSDRPRRHMVHQQVDRMQRAEERIIGWCSG